MIELLVGGRWWVVERKREERTKRGRLRRFGGGWRERGRH